MRAVAPWVRTRLRAAPGPAVALMLLALVTSFLAAVFPRAVEAYESEGLRHELGAASPDLGGVRLSAAPDANTDGLDPAAPAAELSPERLAKQYRQILAALPEPLRADTGQSAYGARTAGKPVAATDPWLPELDGGRPVFTLSAQAGLAEHTRPVSGRLPRATATSPATDAVEGVVTSATARALGIKVGSTVHLPRQGAPRPLAVTVTGIVEPLHPQLSYWSVEPLLRTPTKLYTQPPTPQPYWHGALLLAPESAPALLPVSPETEAYWRIATDASGLTVGDLPRFREAVASLEHGPVRARLRESVSPALEVDTGLDDILLGFDDLLTAIRPVVAVAAVGVGTVAGIVLLMAGGLAVARRNAELSLLRSRGASVRGVAGRLLAEVAVPVLPAAAVGCLLALALVPDGGALPSLLASGAVALLACAALPLRAVFIHRRTRLPGERNDLVRARPSRRRTVAELTLVALAVAAVFALRRRGTDGRVDELVSTAPVLVGVVAALVLVRLYPLPLRLAALPMARRRGAVGFLSLARAGRSPATAALPLLALLVALTTAAFGGSVLAAVADARDRAALSAVGADARIEAADALPDTLADRVRKVAGVREVVTMRREFDVNLRDGDTQAVNLLAVEPEAYARLARATGLGAFSAGLLTAGPGSEGEPESAGEPGSTDGVRPAIASPGVAERLGEGPVEIGTADGLVGLRVVAVRETVPGMPEGEFLLVDSAGLPGSEPATTLLVSGPSVSGTALRDAVRAAGGTASVTLRSAERASAVDSPAQSGAERIYAAATAAGAGYAVLAVVLSLLQSAPERAALLARLRTMGLTRRQGRRLLVLESLPGTLLAALGGALVGWAAIELLGPGIELGRLALATASPIGPVRLRADPWSLLLPAIAVLVIAAGVAAVQAWLSTRRTTTTDLRVGDTR
ncbi:FtsX-like permease family protein [Streptomyces sp. NPDC055078]